MTVWAKLQSWLGASASDVAIDNEFNNIYLGLNEAANGNLPSGYNKVELTFTGASLTIKGETKIGNVNVPLDSTLTVSGATGWRYIVTTNGGVMSVESIPPAEITADTQVYTPTPVFNSSANGYYSTVNTARRIVGICFFDTTIKEAIAYGSCKTKNDDYWYSMSAGVVATSGNDRLQFTNAFDFARGTNVTCVDNGAGTTDSSGFRIQALKAGFLNLNISFYSTYNANTSSGIQVALQKNAGLFSNNVVLHSSNSGTSSNEINQDNYSIRIPVQAGDYFVFNACNITGTASVTMWNPLITFEEI